MKTCLSGYSNIRLLFYKHYIDDIFAVFNTYYEAVSSFEFRNSRHPTIKLTMETKTDKKLSFLDVFISNVSNNF